MKKPIDFQISAQKNGITRWDVHNCSFCNYACGYVFEGVQVFYDSACDCVTYSYLQPRDWNCVAAQYNMQTNDEVIKKMNEFWHFKS